MMSRLQLENQVVSADNNTVGIWHFDNHLYSSRGAKPTGTSIVTMKSDGYFNGAIAMDEATTNLFNSNGTYTQFSTTITEYGINTNGNKIFKVEKTNTENLFTYDSARQLLSVTSNASYTLSFKVKILSGESIESRIGYHWGGTTSNSGIQFIPLNDGWYTCIKSGLSVTATSANCGIGFVGNNEPFSLLFTEVQLELKSGFTQYINTSRVGGNLYYSISFDPRGSWTIFGKSKLTGNSGWQCLFQFGNYYTINESEFEVWVNHNNQMKAYSHENRNGREKLFFTPNAGELNEWFTWAFSRNGETNEYKAYIWTKDRTIEDSWIWNHDYPISYRLGIGSQWQLNGLIDEVRLDNVTRTPEEIQGWYLSQAPFYDPIDTTALSL